LLNLPILSKNVTIEVAAHFIHTHAKNLQLQARLFLTMTSFRFAFALIAMVLVSTATVKATDLTVGDLGTGSALGSASDTLFNNPMSVEVLQGDEVALVTDYFNNRIVNVSLADGDTNEFMTTGSHFPRYLAVCDDGVGYFSTDGGVKEFDTSDTPPRTASPWLSATNPYGLACLKNSTHNLLLLADYADGIRAYDRSNGPPANQDDFVWERTLADLGVSSLSGISLSPDLQHLAFAAYGDNKVGTINIDTKAKQLYGSGTQGVQDGAADAASFYSPWDVAWTPDGSKILVNQNRGSFSGLRFIDFATGAVTSSANNLMPTNLGRGVTVMRSTGDVVVTYDNGLKKMKVAGPVSSRERLHLLCNNPAAAMRHWCQARTQSLF